MTRVVLVLLIGAAAVSTGAIWIRLALTHTGGDTDASLVLAALRLAAAALIMSPGLSGLVSTSTKARRLTWLAGALLAIHFATWIPSLALTSVAASVALTNTHPLWLAAFGFFFQKNRYRGQVWVALALSLTGTILVSLDQGDSSPASLSGNLLALLSGIAFAAYMLVGQSAQRAGISSATYLAQCYLAAALILLPLPLLFDGHHFGYPSQFYLYALLLALVPQLIGHSSFNWALRHASTLWVSQAGLLEPLGAGILAWLLFAEVPTALTLAGVALLLLGFSLSLRG